MDVMDRIARCGLVPVVVLEDAEKAIPTAQALLAGGIDVMEITFRTAAAADSIRNVSRECPEMLVGAGTVVNLEQCKLAVECGAKFIVSPGYDEEVVSWCVDNGIAVTPGCVTPSEIMMALRHGLKVLKFFPAGIYGGVSAIKALSGPFGGVKFIPTGGVNKENLAEYISSPHVHAVGGSWICGKSDINSGNFERITELCKEARRNILGFELAHIGINCPDSDSSMNICSMLNEAFDFETKAGNSSNFSSPGVEVMKSIGRGENGHIAIATNKILPAISELEKRGWELDMESVKDKNNIKAIYLKKEIGGFALHLLQK